MPVDFEWTTHSISIGITREQLLEEMRVPVAEPWWRRVLIRFGLAKQRYRQADFSYLIYGDDAAEPEVFRGLAALYKDGK